MAKRSWPFRSNEYRGQVCCVGQSCRGSFLHHQLDELVVCPSRSAGMFSDGKGGTAGTERTVNSPITILVRFADHLVYLVVGQLLADGGHDVAQLGGGDEAGGWGGQTWPFSVREDATDRSPEEICG